MRLSRSKHIFYFTVPFVSKSTRRSTGLFQYFRPYTFDGNCLVIDTVVWKIAIILHVCKCVTDGSFIIRLRHFPLETLCFCFLSWAKKLAPFTVKQIIQEIIKIQISICLKWKFRSMKRKSGRNYPF